MKKYYIKSFFRGFQEVSKEEFEDYKNTMHKHSILSKDEYNKIMTKEI